MCKVHMLRALVKQRLTAAAQEIFGLFERTLAEYEEELCASREENQRHRELLDAVLNPQLRLHRADGEVIGEEEPQDWSSSLNREDPEPPHIKEDQEDPEPPHIKEDQEDPEPPHITEDQEDPEPPHITEDQEDQEDPEPPHIKEEQEDLWTNQEGEQLEGLEEAGIRFPFSPVKSEDEEEEAQSSHLHQRLTEHMETEAGGEDYRGPGPDWRSGPGPDWRSGPGPDWRSGPGDSSETEVSGHWRETRDPPSGLSSLNNYFSSEKPFRCSVCRKGFGLKGTLKEHMRFHTGEKPFSCSVCKKSFAWRGSLHKHTRIHTREQRFSCSACQSRFTWFHQLKTHTCVGHQSSQLLDTQENREAQPPAGSSTGHMETEEDGEDCGGPEPDRKSDPDGRLDPETDNGDDWKEPREPPSGLSSLNYDDVSLEKPFSCSECQKRFRFKGDLKRHARTHSGEKPFSCSTCGKKFGNSGHLNRHMRIHTGEKPFSCSFCEHRFLQRAHLDAHIRSHTGEKPFSCSFCEKLFSQRGTLRLHMRIHTGEKPFSCSV